MEFLYFIVIGIVAGWLAGKVMRGAGFGLLGDLVIGVIGAVVGGWLFSQFGLVATGLIGSLVISTLGAVALLFLIRLIKQV